jgi:nucleoside-diphosphate-sugar epimerase
MTPEASSERIALVIGAGGAFGHAAANALLAHGWTVRALSRRPLSDERLQWTRGDASDAEAVTAAALGTQVIVQATNPPGYRGWGKLLPALQESAIAAAKASGARLVQPATVYNFDPILTPVVTEDTRQKPRGPKGQIRMQMEQRLQEASREGVKVLILRAGDFFGPPPSNGWLAGGMVKAGAPLRSVTYPGLRKVGHAWAYLPDLGEAMARILDRSDRLGAFEVFHFGGHWLDRGVEMAEAVRRASGRPGLPIRAFPWPLIRALSSFNETCRGLAEMSYLWRQPLRLDNSRLIAFLGEEPHTPLDQAVRASLQGLGCLEPASPAPASRRFAGEEGRTRLAG